MTEKERTLFCGNLSDKVTEDLLYELFLQAGPLERVTIPKDKDGRQRTFSFITFKHVVSVPYSMALMHGISLFGRRLKLDPREGTDSVVNPYMEQLMMQKSNAGDSRERRHDHSRRGDTPPPADNVMYPEPMMYPQMYNTHFNMPYSNFNVPMMPPGYNPFPGYR